MLSRCAFLNTGLLKCLLFPWTSTSAIVDNWQKQAGEGVKWSGSSYFVLRAKFSRILNCTKFIKFRQILIQTRLKATSVSYIKQIVTFCLKSTSPLTSNLLGTLKLIILKSYQINNFSRRNFWIAQHYSSPEQANECLKSFLRGVFSVYLITYSPISRPIRSELPLFCSLFAAEDSKESRFAEVLLQLYAAFLVEF